MTHRVFPWLVAGLFAGAPVLAQQPENGRKQARAIRVTPGAIVIDGRLNDDAWTKAPAIHDFIQRDPVEGAAPSDRIEISFAYDDTALYVGARMSSEHVPIQAPLGRRDEGGQAEYVVVALDTYLDHRTAYGFGVTASGVRIDRFYPADEDSYESETDPVWEARTHVDADGWTAEMWIPFSQLRFNLRDEQVWGLDVFRFVPTSNEWDYWVAVPKTVKAWASRFGELRGVDGIRPARRLELLPYLGGLSTITGNRDPRNPFDDGKNLSGRVGADAKIGLGSNLTLDATVNPDFGQVEADPAEVNLSAFETFFSEKRPFFIEGSGLLNSRRETYFYSRRIGAAPIGPALGDFVDYPRTSTILGAAKLTGRLPSKTSIGVLSAVTGAEHATTFNLASPVRTRVPVAPTTSYSVGRVQQEFGPNASTAAVMVTAVHRDMREGNPLALLLTRNAFTINGDSLLRLRNGLYELSGAAGMSYIDGDAAAIGRVQRNSTHYFQRPDNPYAHYDPARRSMAGGSGALQFARTGGRHWLWNAGTTFESPGLELNDIGMVLTADGITSDASVRYRETQPGRWLRNYSIQLQQFNEWNYGGNRQAGVWLTRVNLTWLNFWTTTFFGYQTAVVQEERLTRGGPLMTLPSRWSSQLELASPSASRNQVSVGAQYMPSEDGAVQVRAYGTLSLRPGPRWQLSMNPSYLRQLDTQQYVATLPGGSPETYGSRYVFAHVERSTYSTQFRFNFTLKPDVTLDVYAEPFAASGAYSNMGELVAARTRAMRSFTLPGSRDFSRESFRGNVVLRWEWRPGSTLYVVWQQNRAATDPIGTRVSIGDMFNSITAPGDHVLAVKTTFWISGR